MLDLKIKQVIKLYKEGNEIQQIISNAKVPRKKVLMIIDQYCESKKMFNIYKFVDWICPANN